MKKIRVLVVDDSAVVRKTFQEYLSKINDIEIVGTAINPYVARDMIVKLKPDVVTLDIEMPKMDGLTFLKKLMKYYPLPIIIVSSLAQESSIVYEALNSGAVDVVAKSNSQFSISEILPDLVEKIRYSSTIDINKVVARVSQKIDKAKKYSLTLSTDKIVAIGASTGGTQAVRDIIQQLPENFPPIVITQHMPPLFTKSYANSLNNISSLNVKEGEDGEYLLQGYAYIAPGNYHMMVVRDGAKYKIKLNSGPKLFYQRPAVEVMFNSVAKYVGKNAIGVILTGMGKDGAKGLLELKNAGAYTIAQDKESSIVWGMPGEAVALNAYNEILSLDKIAKRLIELLK